jgi:TubC N-terminal docking domain
MTTRNSSDTAGFVAELRRQGLTLRPEGDHIRVSPKSVLTPELRDALVARRPEILALLTSEDDQVAWRLEAMRRQVPTSGPIPFLVARDIQPAPGACQSCGAPLGADQPYRCRPCVEAATLTLREWRSRGEADAS